MPFVGALLLAAFLAGACGGGEPAPDPDGPETLAFRACRELPPVEGDIFARLECAIMLADIRVGQEASWSDGARALTDFVPSPDGSFGAPVWSPDGRRLAFIRSVRQGPDGPTTDRITVINPDGGQAKTINIPDLARLFLLTWSPDGHRLAFLGVEAEQADLFVVNIDGSHLVNVTHSPDFEWFTFSPFSDFAISPWSPDGERLAFASANPGGRTPTLTVVARDGTGRHELAQPAMYAGWAPDGGAVLAFGDLGAGQGIYRVDVACSAASLLVARSPDGLAASGLVAWSADGKRLAFTGSNSQTNQTTIAVANADGTSAVTVTRGDCAWGKGVTWSPRGRYLAFVTGCDEDSRLSIVAPTAGATPHQAPHKPYRDTDAPAWRPLR